MTIRCIEKVIHLVVLRCDRFSSCVSLRCGLAFSIRLSFYLFTYMMDGCLKCVSVVNVRIYLRSFSFWFIVCFYRPCRVYLDSIWETTRLCVD